MMWLAWRQHRLQALAGAIGLGLLAVLLLVTHAGIASTFKSTGLASCLAHPGRDCGAFVEAFDQHFHGLQFLAALFLVIPMLVGLFWGAPLVARELEQGTYRLVWTQSATRRLWFSTKFATLAGASLIGGAAFAALVTWWSQLFVRVDASRFTPGSFDLRGIVPVGYILFALALGVLIGTLVRRTLPAMAATLAAFVGVRVLVNVFVRPHYLPAKTTSMPVVLRGSGILVGGPDLTNGWIINQVTVDRFGHLAYNGGGVGFSPFMASHCRLGALTPPNLPSPGQLSHCISKLGLHTVTTYQPAGRFWAFQGIESAIYVALAAALFLVAGWFVRRRLA